MRKDLIIAGSALLITLASAPAVFASSNLTEVRGNVYNGCQGNVCSEGGTVSNSELAGLTVTVICDTKDTGNKLKTVSKTALTDSYGLYTVNMKEKKCEGGHNVTASVTFKGVTQTNSAYVAVDALKATIDFYFSIPVTGTGTGYGGGKGKESVCKKTGNVIIPYVKITIPVAEAEEFISKGQAIALPSDGKCPSGISLRDFISRILKNIFG